MSWKLPAPIRRLTAKLGLSREWYLIALGVGVGVITAFGAIAFKGLLDLAAESSALLYDGYLAVWALPLLPMIGALITGALVFRFAPEAKGHGVPEVMDALYRHGARIRPRVAFVKSLTSISTIGSGGSAGAEGPIVQIGSAIGSWVAQKLRLSREHTGTLLGCGAAAGIASVFNAPLAGLFFVIEILLRDLSVRTFTPVVLASVVSNAVTQAVLGHNNAIFAVSRDFMELYKFTPQELPLYIVLGLFCGVVAVGFIKILYRCEDIYDTFRLHPVAKPVTGALLLGVLGIAFTLTVGQPGPGHRETAAAPAAVEAPHEPDHHAGLPPFYGNGYQTIRELLLPASYWTPAEIAAATEAAAADAPAVTDTDAQHRAQQQPGELRTDLIDPADVPSVPPGAGIRRSLLVLALLVVCKAIATGFTLGSGGSGGVFAPSLFLGAATGAGVGVGLDAIGLLPANGSPAAYALVGMAAVVAATTHAPLTAMLIVLELTRDVYVLLPIMLAVTVALVMAQLVMPDSIYSLKLRRRGVVIGTSADLTLLRRIIARDVNLVPHVAVRAEDPLSKLLELRDAYKIVDFVVTDAGGRYEGIVTAGELRTALIEREAIPYLLVEDLMRTDLPTIDADESLDLVFQKFSVHDVASLPMVETDRAGGIRVLGLLTRGRLMQCYQKALSER